MKKSLGNLNAAFPTPIVVVGALVNDQPNWFEVAWVGIGDNHLVTLSVTKSHYTCDGIRKEKVLSISLVDQKHIPQADYTGVVSGKKADKSKVFAWEKGKLGAPIPTDLPVTMECELYDIYEKDDTYLLICKVVDTTVDESILGENGKIDYNKFKPVLFTLPFNYILTGDPIEPCGGHKVLN